MGTFAEARLREFYKPYNAQLFRLLVNRGLMNSDQAMDWLKI